MPHRDHGDRGSRLPRESGDQQLDGQDTDDLLLAAGRGEQGALGALYDATSSVVFQLLYGVLEDPALAERTTEQVYLHMWRTAPLFDPAERSAYSLLLQTVRRELVGGLHTRAIQHRGTLNDGTQNSNGAQRSGPIDSGAV